MQRAYVIDMTNGDILAALIEQKQPNLVIPEIEAVATAELEDTGTVSRIPTATTTLLIIYCEGIRRRPPKSRASARRPTTSRAAWTS